MLATLAWLQYRAIREVSQASAGQILATLQGALMDFRQGVERELSPVCRQFSSESGLRRSVTLPQIAQQYADWQRRSVHPQLIANVYVWRDVETTAPTLLRLGPGAGHFEPAEWPQNTSQLQNKLRNFTAIIAGASPLKAAGRPVDPGPQADPATADHPERAFSWMIDQGIPMLAYAVQEPSKAGVSKTAWILVQLDRKTLWEQLLPEIARRALRNGDRSADEFAFSDGREDDTIVLSLDGQFGKSGSLEPEASLNIFGMPQMRLKGTHGDTAHASLPMPPNFNPEHFVRIEPIRYPADTADWAILGKSQEGSVEDAVRGLYYRSLATNFGVLLLLIVAIVSLIVSTQKSRQLSQMQMDFVANVSHELRTPLTGIVAAGQNIADGVVQSQEKTVSYGKAIVRQAQHLTELVEQILLFSATQKGRHQYHMEPTPVAELVKGALDRTAGVLTQAGTHMEVKLPLELPLVNVDSKAMTQCLQNLIVNAVKYGGEHPWVGLQASHVVSDDVKEIQIAVADKGVGIEPNQLRLIFEPFYRTPDATAAQIHGSGLGLPLAKSITEAMGGRLTVVSTPNEGSTFTVHLPVASNHSR